MAEREEIEARFADNLTRVRNLVALYRGQSQGPGRKDIAAADLLRVAVVLLHATLEDLLRSLAEWKLPTAPAASLEKIPFMIGDRPADKISLAELADHRGRPVDEVINRSIKAHLDRSSFNNVGEIIGLLRKIDLDPGPPDRLKSDLAAMMNRRHWIAHRVDHNPSRGAGHQAAQAISLYVVETWIASVESLGASILGRL